MISISQISNTQFDKLSRQMMARQIINDLAEGTEDPVKTHYNIKCIEELIKLILSDKEYKSIVLFEAEKHGRSFDFENAKMEIKETGVKYDFAACGDPDWDYYESQINSFKEKQKERESFLKTIRADGLNIFDPLTGESYTICPPVKTSTTTVAVNLK